MICSLQNNKIKKISKLLNKKYRDKEDLFLVEGEKLIKEAKKHNLVLEKFSIKEKKGYTMVSLEVMKKISSTKNIPSFIALCKKWKNKFELGNKVIALNKLQDPGNIGTIIRSAVCFGFDSIIIEKVDIFNPKIIRSSQGSIFQIPIFQTDNISQYFDGYEVVGTLLDKKAQNFKEYKPLEKFILVFGNEGNGIEEKIIKKLDKTIYIPINFESLNVAVCAGILMSEYSKK